MGRIFQRGKIWYIDFRVKNRRIRKRIGTSKRVAELALKDAEVKAERKEFGFDQKDIKIDLLLDKFLEYSQTNHRDATTTRYGSVVIAFRVFLKDYRSIMMVSDVTPLDIENYKTFRKNLVYPVSTARNESCKKQLRRVNNKTINYELKVLTTFFTLAIKWGYLKENPVREVRRLKVVEPKTVRFLSSQECKKFLDACPNNLYPIFFTYLNTGMRLSELINLEWPDIDFKRKKIKIQWKEHWQPKTGEREIPLSKKMLALLLDLKKKNEMRRSFVFCEKDGGKIEYLLRYRLVEIAKEAGIENLTKIHTLRHTFASHLVMNGVDLPTVQNLLGHSNIQTTMIYAHLAPDHLSDAVEKLGIG